MFTQFNEQKRLEELASFDIMDTEPELEFDELAELAAQICGCPVTAINFIGQERQFSKAKIGGPLPELREHAFCTYTIQNDGPLVVEDATKDQRFSSNPFVGGERGIRFYAGVPILSPSNIPLGSVCVIDSLPRQLTEAQIAGLKLISKQVTRLLELRQRNRLLRDYTRMALSNNESLFTSFFERDGVPKCIYDTASLNIIQVNQAWVEKFGFAKEDLLQVALPDLLEGDKSGYLDKMVENTSTPFMHTVFNAQQKKKDGSLVDVEINLSEIVYLGKPARLATVVETTDRALLKQQGVQRQAEIQRVSAVARRKEREHIGKELHDNINQILTASRLYLDMAEQHDDIRLDMIRRCKDAINGAIGEVRALSKALVTHPDAGFNFTQSIRDLLNTYGATKKFKVHLSQTGDIEQVPDDLKLNLFRIIQEQFTNIAKHAEALHVHLSVIVAEHVQVCIEDDGKGFHVEGKHKDKDKGIGLSNISKRVAFYNGSMQVKSAPGSGTVLNVIIPIVQNSDAVS